jgi:hypothetical protein
MLWESDTENALQLQTKAGGVIILRDHEQAADWVETCENRPRGFAAMYRGLQIIRYKLFTDTAWRNC